MRIYASLHGYRVMLQQLEVRRIVGDNKFRINGRTGIRGLQIGY
jgi:hypothetical protein